MARPSPIADQLGAFGAVMTEACGVLVPERFGDPLEEHRCVRTGAGLFDLSHRGLIQVTGPDRVSWFKGQCTNEVVQLTPGQGNHTAIVTRLGKMITDAILSVTERDLWLELNADRVAPTLEHLEKYHVTEKIEIRDRTRDYGILGVHGPNAARLLAALGGQAVPDAPQHHFAEKSVSGIPVRVQRSDMTGEVGFTLTLPTMALAPAFGMLTSLGGAHGLRPAGYAAWQSLRIEAGVPFYEAELSDQLLPLEAGLEGAVSFTKGCYLGQEVIARVATIGEPSRALVGLAVTGERVPQRDDPVLAGGAETGKVTSAVRSPTLGRVIALAIVKKEQKAVGTVVSVRPAAGGEECRAEVAPLPFYRKA